MGWLSDRGMRVLAMTDWVEGSAALLVTTVVVLLGAGLAVSLRKARHLRKRVALTKEEFVRQLGRRGISAQVADAVYRYYSGLVGGQVQLFPGDLREGLAGSGPEDCIDDTRLILRRLSIDKSFDELEHVVSERSLDLRSLEDIAHLVQFVLSESGHDGIDLKRP